LGVRVPDRVALDASSFAGQMIRYLCCKSLFQHDFQFVFLLYVGFFGDVLNAQFPAQAAGPSNLYLFNVKLGGMETA